MVLGFTLVLGSRLWWVGEFVEDVGVVVMVVFCWGEEGCFCHCHAYDVLLFDAPVVVSADVVSP